MYSKNYTVAIPDGAANPSSALCVSYFNPLVKIGGRTAQADSCSAAPGLVGVGRLIVTVPPDLATGAYSVSVSMDNISSNSVQLPVQHP
jgi:uncharacterized protein (TIGR03437 family)